MILPHLRRLCLGALLWLFGLTGWAAGEESAPAADRPDEETAVIERHLQRGQELLATELPAAIAELRLAAKSQRADTMHLVGRILFYDVGTEEARAEAVDLFTHSAMLGHAEALVTMAVLHQLGDGVTRDEGLAFDLLGRAAESGHAMAHATLGQIYLRGNRAVPQDYARAFAHGGLAVSLGEIGGHSIRVKAAREMKEADKRAARAMAEKFLAELQERYPDRFASVEYRAGIDHLMSEEVKAVQRRAEGGDTEAMMQMAELYASELELPHDPEAVVQWTLRAAERGHLRALVSLGSYLLEGLYGVRDPKVAYVYLSAADTLGEPEAKLLLDQAREQLDEDQRIEADRRVLQLLKSIHAPRTTP